MGNYTIIIEGSGLHGNENNPDDADKLLLEFISDLKKKNHNIQHVSFTGSQRKVLEKIGPSYRFMPG